MKKIIFLLVICLLIFGCSQKNGIGFLITMIAALVGVMYLVIGPLKKHVNNGKIVPFRKLED